MNQINTLSDIFSQTSSLLNGLLSQMGSNDANSNLFSSLLSQDSENLSAPPSIPPTVNVASSYANSSTTLPSSTDLLQSLQNISTTMQNLLSLLHHQNSNSASSNTSQQPAQSSSSSQQTTQSQAQSSTPSNTSASASGNSQSTTSSEPDTTTNSKTSTDKTTDTTSSTTPTATDLQSLAALVAQLLVIFQALMLNMQQPKVATGSTADIATASTIGATTASTSSGASTGDTTQTAKTLQALQSLLNAINNPSSGATQSASMTTASPTDELAQILTDLQNMTGSLLPATTTVASQPAITQTTDTPKQEDTSADILGNIAVEVAQFDEKLNHVISWMQQQNKASSTASSPADTNAALVVPTTSKSVTPSLLASNIKLPQAALPVSQPITQQPTPSQQSVSTQTSAQQAPMPPAKTDLSGTWQNQALSFQNNSASSSTQPTAAQVFTNSAALVVAAEHNTGSTSSEAGSDFMSNGQNSSPQVTLGSNSALSAEGTQAAGTYNFASTLSALRATNGGSVGLPSVIDQVILQMNRNVKSGNDQMTLQLNPTDLGKITIKLDFGSDNKVQGTVTADNPQTLSLIQKDSRSLERALQDAGLRTDPGSLQFNLGSQSGNGAGNNAGQTANNGNNTNSNAGNGTLSAGDNAGLVDIGTIAETYYITPNGVNIQV